MKIKLGAGLSLGERTLLAVLFILASLTLLLSEGGGGDREGEITVRLTADYARESPEDEISGLLSEFYDILPSEVAGVDSVDGVSFSRVFEWIREAFSDGGASALSHFTKTLGLCLLLALAESAVVKDGLSPTVSAGVSGALSIPLSSSLIIICGEVSETIRSGCEFFGGMIPIATAATALSGLGATAAAQGSAMSLALGFISSALLPNLTSCVSLMFAFSMLSSFDTGGFVGKACGFVKGIFNFFLGIITFLLPATLSLQSVIASAKDGMALRSARYAIGNMIPVVGGALSSMLSTLVSGAGFVTHTVGALSVGAIGFIFIAPLLRLLLIRLSYKICMGFLDFVGVTLGKRTVSSLISALDTLIAALCMSGAVFLLESVIFMKSAVNL